MAQHYFGNGDGIGWSCSCGFYDGGDFMEVMGAEDAGRENGNCFGFAEEWLSKR